MPIENNNYQYIPLVAHFPSETDQEFSDRWEKIDRLPEDIKDKLSSEEVIQTLRQAERIFSLDIQQITVLSIVIRQFYFREIKSENIPETLAKNLSLDPAKIKELSNFIVQKIINNDYIDSNKSTQSERMTLSEAIKKYPAIEEQIITSGQIKLNKYPQPARASIKNWLADYTFTMGFEKHDSAERGIYLFQSQNTRNLNSQERNNLNHILKSFDTGGEVEVDTAAKKIIFPKPEFSAAPTKDAPSTSVSYGSFPKKQITPAKPSKPSLSGKFTFSQEERRALMEKTEKRLPQSQPIQKLPIGQKTFLPQKPSAPTSRKIDFSSPQKLPFEQEKIPAEKKPTPVNTLRPIRIMPSGFNAKKEIPIQDQKPKNVVNLKEK